MPKQYVSGESLRVGDKVLTGDGVIGTIVAVIDDHEYSPEFSEAVWGHYKAGVLVLSDEIGLAMYDGEDEDQPRTTFTRLAAA